MQKERVKMKEVNSMGCPMQSDKACHIQCELYDHTRHSCSIKVIGESTHEMVGVLERLVTELRYINDTARRRH